jgi:DNA-directed RNA polymerase specialized sigma24 family protein
MRSSMPCEAPGSISGWLIVLKGSDDRAEVDDAVRALWERYFDRLVRREPTPELAATVADEVRHLLGPLPTDGYRAIALKKLEGYANDEIAGSLGCTTKNVEFKLRNIRATWLALLSEGRTVELPP